MTRSDDLPKALPSMWRLCKLGYQHEPGLLVFAFVMTLLAALPDALLALWLKVLADGVLRGDRRAVFVAAFGMALSVTATWFLRTLSARISRRFRDRVTIMLEAHVARLQATVATVEHHERRDYLDRLSVLRKQVFVLDHMYMSLFSTCGWILRLAVTVGLLMSINPLLALLVLFAVPTVVSSSWRPGVERSVEEKNASHQRLSEHLFRTATTPAPGKDVRVTGIGPSLVTDRRLEWERWYEPIARVRWVSAGWHAAAWAIFGAAYVGAVLFVASGLDGSVGDVLLILAAGARLSSYIGATVGEIGFLRGIWLDGSRRLVWLENYAASFDAGADLAGACAAHRRDPAGGRLVQLRRFRQGCPGQHFAASPGRQGDRRGRRERRREVHPGEADRQALRTVQRCHPLGRPTPVAHPRRRVARPDRRRLPGLLPLRVPGPAQRRPGRPPPPGRRAGGHHSCHPRRSPGRSRPPRLRPRHPTRLHLARRRRTQLRPMAEARPGPRLHARQPTPTCPRRTHRSPGRRNRTRPLRTLRPSSPHQHRRPHHPPGLPPLLHRPHGRPHSRPRRRPPSRNRHPRIPHDPQRPLRRPLQDPSRRLPLTRFGAFDLPRICPAMAFVSHCSVDRGLRL